MNDCICNQGRLPCSCGLISNEPPEFSGNALGYGFIAAALVIACAAVVSIVYRLWMEYAA